MRPALTALSDAPRQQLFVGGFTTASATETRTESGLVLSFPTTFQPAFVNQRAWEADEPPQLRIVFLHQRFCASPLLCVSRWGHHCCLIQTTT